MPTALLHEYTPLGAAKELFDRREPEVLMSGPAGTGKSRACLEKLHACALLNPGMKGLMVRKTQKSLTSTALETWREHVVSEAIQEGIVRYYGGSGSQPAQYKYINGSSILMIGMDNSTKIMSSEFDMIYVQEAIELKESDWQALLTRLRNGRMTFQQLIADTNPDAATHWLKQRSEKGVCTLLESRHEDNPIFWDDFGELNAVGSAYMQNLDSLTGTAYLRYREGKWVTAEGQILHDWDTQLHLIDPFEIPEEWRRYYAIDFGFTDPFVCQWWAEDHDGRLYLYRELVHTKRLVEDHARQIRILSKDEPSPSAVICDHDAEGRATLQRYLELSSTIAAHKTVSDGIQAVQSRLRKAGDGKPRLFVFRDAVIERDQKMVDNNLPIGFEQEATRYVWDEGKEKPVKEYDHSMDAARYMVAHKDLRARVGVRFLRNRY